MSKDNLQTDTCNLPGKFLRGPGNNNKPFLFSLRPVHSTALPVRRYAIGALLPRDTRSHAAHAFRGVDWREKKPTTNHQPPRMRFWSVLFCSVLES